ncbi:MAG: hypothetical protein ACMG6S_11185 [Byssovorax sp.]
MSTPKKIPPPGPALQSSTATAKPTPLAPSIVLSTAASYAGITPKPPAYDPTVAAALLKTFRPRLDAIADGDLLVPRVDVRASALAALGVYAFVTQADALHERFQRQHSIGELDIDTLEGLKAAAFIVFYTHAQAEAAGAFETDAKVPASVIQEGMKIEGRMQELCEYKFKREPTIAPLLAVLRPGTSYRDLAGDLLGYADIYEMSPAKVAEDTTNYLPTDVADARRVAGEILAHLAASMSPKARDAYALLQRAWTLLVQTYFEVQEVGKCLLRRDPKRDDWFPSLYAAGRSGRPRKKNDEAAPGTPKDGGAPKTPAG